MPVPESVCNERLWSRQWDQEAQPSGSDDQGGTQSVGLSLSPPGNETPAIFHECHWLEGDTECQL